MKLRIGALALSLAIILSLGLFGDQLREKIEIKEGFCYETTGISPNTVVMKVDGMEVPMDLYFFYLNNSASYLEQFMAYYLGMELDWEVDLQEGQTAADLVRESTEEELRSLCAQEKLMKDHNISFSEETNTMIAEQLAQVVAQVGGEQAYLAELEKLGLREETYERIFGAAAMTDALYLNYATEGSALYAADETIADYAAEQGYVTADHILFLTKDMATGEAYDEARVAEQRALAEETLGKLKLCSGDLTAYFTTLADEYSEDTGRLTNPTGYTFTTGTMVAEFEEAAFALAEGEVSGIVESDYGFHILLRKPLDIASADAELREGYFTVMMNDFAAKAEITDVDERLEGLDIPAIYEAFIAAQNVAAQDNAAAEDTQQDAAS